MSLDQSAVVPSLPTGYTIDQSLRFNDNDTARLSRTPSSAGNRKTWTWSGWSKRSTLGSVIEPMFDSRNGSTLMRITWNGDDIQVSRETIGVGYAWHQRTNAEYRDPSAWYHIVVAFDTTQSTASNRVKLYVNGVQVTSFSSSSYPSQNTDWEINATYEHHIGLNYDHYYDGYLAEINFIDGQALDPTSFGETGDYGEWKPIRYTGSYGTNGFYLDFDGTYYNDKSGNGNNWTATNLATTDVVLDSPTNNFCTLNPLMPTANTNNQLIQGNLVADATSSTWSHAPATWSLNSGKWYWEVAVSSDSYVGMSSPTVANVSGSNSLLGWDSPYLDAWIYHSAGYIRHNGSNQSTVASLTSGDIVGLALDVDSGTLKFYKNNSLIYTASDDFTDWYPDSATINTTYDRYNFGQDSSFAGNKTAQGNTDSNGQGDFYYTPPSGYLAMCTANLPDPTVIPTEHFNTVIYTGTGDSLNRSVTGVGFQPDMVWQDRRSTVSNAFIFDAVRGVGSNKDVVPNRTEGQGGTNGTGQYGYISSFDSDGFSTTKGSINNDIYNSVYNFVAWNWKANGSGSSNTNGSITSTVSANQDAGFSIVTYTGNGSTATVGHGLSSAPQMIIVKRTSATENWAVYNEPLGPSQILDLDRNVGKYSNTARFNNTAPTNQVFSLGNHTATNSNGSTYVAYCFHSVDGYSKVGSFEGNGSSDGTFVNTGFRPLWLMIKNADGVSDWHIKDNKRDIDNPTELRLQANLSDAESGTYDFWDHLSNGFKMRSTGSTNYNGSTYVYLAFAENPFKHTNAR